MKRETCRVYTPFGDVTLRAAAHCGMVQVFFDGTAIQETQRMREAFLYCKDEGFEEEIIEKINAAETGESLF